MKFNAKTISIGIASVVCALFILQAVTLLFEGEEGRLKRTIYRGKKFIEKESILGVAGGISADYSDELGNDKRSLLFITKNFFDNQKNILVKIEKLDVEIEGETATARIEATVYWQGDAAKHITYDMVEAEAKFRKEEKDWKLIGLKLFEPEKKELLSPAAA